MSQPELAELLGTSRNTITNWENDRSLPTASAIRDLSQILGIPLYELFALSNDEIPSPHEAELLKQYRQLSDLGQKVTDRMVASILQEEIDIRDSHLREQYFLLPLESTPAAAGSGCDFVEIAPEYRFIKKNRYNASADALIRVSGASMEPIYHDGDMVYIKYSRTADDGNDVICSTADGAVIKRLRDRKLFSLNQDLPFGEKSEDDHVVILGIVLGVVGSDDLPDEADLSVLEVLKADDISEFNRTHPGV